jgi:tyrosyl-tRNA synthetase
VLARQVTELVHGIEATDAVIAASEALFGQGDLAALDAGTLESAVAELPHASLPASTTVAQALYDTGLTSSLSEARRAIGQGGVYLNNVKVDDEAATLEGAALAGGRAVLRRGKKTLAGVTIS